MPIQSNHQRSTCPYCGVGCGVIIESANGHITGVKGDPDHPANFGRLCTKGSTLALTATPNLQQATRLLTPMRRAQRGQKPEPVSWLNAMNQVSQQWADIVTQHGPDAVGFYISGQLLTEDYYVFNKLAKGLLGTNNIDTNSRLCMSSAVAGYKATLGADAPPTCYEDIDHAHTLFIAGSNTAWAHPVLYRRIEDAKAARPNLKMIVVDPRSTDTARMADLHLPLQPGTDVALYHGLLHIMLWEGWLDTAYIAAHTTGFDAIKTMVRSHTPDHVASVCGLSTTDLYTAAQWFAGIDPATGTRSPTLSLYCQGLNQSTNGTANNAALINLHLATGQIGRAGAGPFSLTGQPNAMGGREVGGMANLLSAHRDLSNPNHRAEVAQLWGVPSVPSQAGKTAVDMFQAAADGHIKALWIACTNPAQSMPDQTTVRRALERAELVVVQEAYADTATCAYADLLLPATTWGEKNGTVTNSERRISRVRTAIAPPCHPQYPLDGPRHDWRIATDLAQRLHTLLHPGLPISFEYHNPESVWNEHRESTRGQDLDITGLSYALLDTQGPQQWPMPQGQTQGKARLYENGQFATPDGKARFAAMPARTTAESTQARYPFALNTGRLRDQWHGMSRTGHLGRLFGHVPEPCLHMHPQDMGRRGLLEGQLVKVSSARGSLWVPIAPSTDVGLSQVFMAMHWGSEFISGQGADGAALAGVNALTTSAYCPTSKQPELKHAAVRIDKASHELPYTLLAIAWLTPEQAPHARTTLRQLMPQLGYATCVPFGNESATSTSTGLLFRAAHTQAINPRVLDEIEAALHLNTPQALRYNDAQQGHRRVILRNTSMPESKVQGLLLAGNTQAEPWLKALLQNQQPLPVGTPTHHLLHTGSVAPASLSGSSAPSSPQVCNCLNVSAAQIQNQLAHCTGNPSDQLGQLQSALKCGTHCGSCLPQIKQLVQVHRQMQSG